MKWYIDKYFYRILPSFLEKKQDNNVFPEPQHVTDNGFDIWDEKKNVVYLGKRNGALGQNFKLFDLYGREIATVKQKIPTFTPQFILTVADKDYRVLLKRKLNGKGYCIVKDTQWATMGDFDNFNYSIVKGDDIQATVKTIKTSEDRQLPEALTELARMTKANLDDRLTFELDINGNNIETVLSVFLAFELSRSVESVHC